jgi:hypothetical protein
LRTISPQVRFIGGRKTLSGSCGRLSYTTLDSDESFDPLVVGNKVFVADRPVNAVSIVSGSLEIIV